MVSHPVAGLEDFTEDAMIPLSLCCLMCPGDAFGLPLFASALELCIPCETIFESERPNEPVSG